MKTVFWNTNKNARINSCIRDIIIDNNIDIIILAEYKADASHLKDMLSVNNINMNQYVSRGCDRITLLGKYKDVEPAFQNTYCSLHIIKREYILACLHLPSKMYCDRRKKDIVIREIIYEIQKLEEKLNCRNTIITGDFNENPYEKGCLAADTFHGLPDYVETKRGYRTILGSKFEMFYNPMWNLLGDFSFPSGTFYYNGNDVSNPFWNIYDQVMIRPCLRNKFIDDKLEIICQAGETSLIDKRNNMPDRRISDHLPIVFEIKE